MSKLVSARCLRSRGAEKACKKEILLTTISTREMWGKLFVQNLVVHRKSQVGSVSTKAEPTNHLFALIAHKILQFLRVDTISVVVQKIRQRTCYNGLHIWKCLYIIFLNSTINYKVIKKSNNSNNSNNNNSNRVIIKIWKLDFTMNCSTRVIDSYC